MPTERIYLDAAPIIYAVEQVPAFASAVDARISAPGVFRVTSELTRMECRVKPVAEGNVAMLKDYEEFFERAVAEMIPLSRQVLDRATEIRAKHRVRTPDAIHLAAALVAGCRVFLTNDHRLDKVGEIAVEIVQAS